MIEVLFIRVPGEKEREKLFARLRDFVSGECYDEALGYRSKEVGLRWERHWWVLLYGNAGIYH